MNFLDTITEFIFAEDEIEKADVILIPGGPYPELSEKAASLYKLGYGDWVIPSGRFSILNGAFYLPEELKKKYNKPYQTEWEFLKDILVQNGVSESVILKEDRATYTYENAIFSKAVLKEAKIPINKAVITCQAFHARRCQLYYQLLFPDTKIYICPVRTQGIDRTNWFRSEEKIDKVLGEVERCGSQFHQIIKDYSRTNTSGEKLPL